MKMYINSRFLETHSVASTTPLPEKQEYPTQPYPTLPAVHQKFQPASRSSFGEVAMALFMYFTSSPSQSVHIVFDEYRTVSIKNMERARRGTKSEEGVQYKNILSAYPVKS